MVIALFADQRGLYQHGVLVMPPSAQLMTVVGNIAYIALAVLGGLWFPYLPRMAPIYWKADSTYQLMQVVSTIWNTMNLIFFLPWLY